MGIVNLTGHRTFQKDKKSGLWISKLEYTNDRGILVKGNSKELFERIVALTVAYYTRNKETIDVIIQGCANGFDLAGAIGAIRVGIPVHSYVPYVGHGNWKTFYAEVHSEVLEKSEKVNIPLGAPPKGGEFAKFLLQRNKDMVDNSDYTLALWDGTSGGTSHCVNYAQSQGKRVKNLWPIWEKHRGRV